MPAEKTTRKQVLKTGFFKHLQNTDSLTVIQRLIFINFQTAPVFEQTAQKCIIFAVSKREKCEPDGHLLWPREVTIDDRRQSSIKTQKQRYQSREEESKDAGKHKMMKLRSTQKRSWEAQDDEAEKYTET